MVLVWSWRFFQLDFFQLDNVNNVINIYKILKLLFKLIFFKTNTNLSQDESLAAKQVYSKEKFSM